MIEMNNLGYLAAAGIVISIILGFFLPLIFAKEGDGMKDRTRDENVGPKIMIAVGVVFVIYSCFMITVFEPLLEVLEK